MMAMRATPFGLVALPVGARHLVLYDGVCGLCDRTVQALLSADRRGLLAYAPLQGETAAALRPGLDLDPALDSLVLIADFGTARQRVLVRSRAALAIASALGGAWRLLGALRVVPAPLRDWVYDLVARHRYRWFGRFDVCKLPEKGTAARFLP